MTSLDRVQEFLLPSARTFDAVRNCLPKGCVLEPRARFQGQRIFLDSFDWRIHKAGYQFYAEQASGARQVTLYCRRLDEAKEASAPPTETKLRKLPTMVDDVPSGPMQAWLRKALSGRALVVYARTDCESENGVVLDNERKTVVRMSCERTGVSPETALPLQEFRVRLVGLRGYEDEIGEMAARMLNELSLPSAPANLLIKYLSTLERAPSPDGRDDAPVRDPSIPAGEGLRIILRWQLAALETNEPGALADIDPEFLHDYRVAIRRTRTALGQLRRVLPDVERFREGFRELGTVTGPVRDLDVFRDDLPGLRAGLPEAMKDTLEPFETLLKNRRSRARSAFKKHLASKAHKDLLRTWRAFLEGKVAAGNPIHWPTMAREPIGLMADTHIWRAYRKAVKEGQAISDDSPAEALHDLRKTCKKLRYLMEFFAGLYPEDELGKQISTLKKLQNVLGDFQDFEVQAGMIRGSARVLMRRDNGENDAVMAMGAMASDLLARQQARRADFAASFSGFASPATKKAFAKLFNAKPAHSETGEAQ